MQHILRSFFLSPSPLPPISLSKITLHRYIKFDALTVIMPSSKVAFRADSVQNFSSESGISPSKGDQGCVCLCRGGWGGVDLLLQSESSPPTISVVLQKTQIQLNP